MEIAGSYLTLRSDAAAEVEVSRSRFLAVARRIDDEQHALAAVAARRREHPAARHHCWAWRLADGRERAHDDGEPSGTAGRPMLEVVRGRGLADVVVVVTRYFGGTLLGAGGLVRAYGGAAAAALDGAGTLRRVPLDRVGITVDHERAGALQGAVRAAGFTVDDVSYGTCVELVVAVPAASRRSFDALVAAVSRGSAGTVELGVRWADHPDP